MPDNNKKPAIPRKRRETNEQIMQESINERGYVRLRIQPGVLHSRSGAYVGYQGGSCTLDFPSVKVTREFLRRQEAFMQKFATEFPVSISRRTTIQAKERT